MSVYEQSEYEKMGEIFEQVSKHRVVNPQDILNRVHKYEYPNKEQTNKEDKVV